MVSLCKRAAHQADISACVQQDTSVAQLLAITADLQSLVRGALLVKIHQLAACAVVLAQRCHLNTLALHTLRLACLPPLLLSVQGGGTGRRAICRTRLLRRSLRQHATSQACQLTCQAKQLAVDLPCLLRRCLQVQVGSLLGCSRCSRIASPFLQLAQQHRWLDEVAVRQLSCYHRALVLEAHSLIILRAGGHGQGGYRLLRLLKLALQPLVLPLHVLRYERSRRRVSSTAAFPRALSALWITTWIARGTQLGVQRPAVLPCVAALAAMRALLAPRRRHWRHATAACPILPRCARPCGARQQRSTHRWLETCAARIRVSGPNHGWRPARGCAHAPHTMHRLARHADVELVHMLHQSAQRRRVHGVKVEERLCGALQVHWKRVQVRLGCLT